MIRIITITDPIDPSRGKIVTEVPEGHLDGRNLQQLVYKHAWYADPGDVEWEAWANLIIVSVNGHVWPRSLWSEIIPRDGDCIVIAPVVQGGGLIRTLASVALLAGSIALSSTGFGVAALGFTLSALGATLTTATVSAILVGAVNIAGNLLISALLGPNAPSNKSNSASFDPDGPQTLAQSGVVIPKGYGTFMWGGNIISSFTDFAGTDQFINLLVCFGFGPARSITGIQINGKDIADYQNVQYYTRLGTNDQTEIGQFNQISNGYPQNTQCLAGIPVVVPGTGTLTQALQVDIAYPSGLYVDTNDGNIIPLVITWLLEYSVSGANDWQPVIVPQTTASVTQLFPNGSPYFPGGNQWGVIATDLDPRANVVYHVDSGPHSPGDPWTGTQSIEVFAPNGNHYTYNKQCQGEWQYMDVNQNYVYVLTWSQGYQDVVGAQTSPMYSRSTILGLAPGKYDVRITKYGSARLHDDVGFGDNFAPTVGQDMWVHSVNEITYQDLAYPNMILLGVRALATSQLSGSGIKVTAIIQHGLRTIDTGVMPTALAAFEEDNPACIAADMMLDDLYGGGAWPGITPANIERYIDRWVAYAESNDTLVPDGNGNSIRLHVFNGVFDNEDNLWAQVGRVGNMSRAAFVPVGMDYDVFVDQAVDGPEQMFTMGNILQDSFTETWLPLDDRANQVEVQFSDATRYYKADNPLVYMDPAQQDAGVVIKNTRIKAVGVTSPAQAFHLARYKERCNQFLLRTGSFRTDTDGIACRVGSVIALQHDVPQWGYGGRTLPGSSTVRLLIDRSDVPFVAGSYSVMVQHAAVKRYTGTVTGVATGTQPPSYIVSLSSFDGEQRVTRIVFADGFDAAVLSSQAGQVTIASPLPEGVTIGTQGYTLYDTDVLETVGVVGISTVGCDPGTAALLLTAPLGQAPDDFGLYIYGPSGGIKLARVTLIRKASEFRSTIEWIDYDTDIYTVATPLVGETSAIVKTNPGVTNLTGAETFQQVAGSYIGYANLAWQNGPDTVGVGIYVSYPSTVNYPASNDLPQLVARLSGSATTWAVPISPGAIATYTVVGFDANNVYASAATAPTVTINAVGIADNLLLDSTFASGFAYWNLTPRAGDAFVPDFSDGGEAVYTVAGTALTAAQAFINQVIVPSKYAAGNLLILSGYLKDSCAVSTAPNVGTAVLTITAKDSSGAVLGTVSASAALNGVTPTLNRYFTSPFTVPTGTAVLYVSIGFAGTGLSLPVGSTVTMSHLLLEVATAGQTQPSAWADIDISGHVTDLFTSGTSTGLRVQGSVLPSFIGSISLAYTDTTVTPSWTGLAVLWPDGAISYIQDGTGPTVTGLIASTAYRAFPYFDLIYGGVKFVTPAVPTGTPAILTAAASDVIADAACRQDGRIALSAGGISVTTAPAGGTGLDSGGGGVNNPGEPLPELPSIE